MDQPKIYLSPFIDHVKTLLATFIDDDWVELDLEVGGELFLSLSHHKYHPCFPACLPISLQPCDS